MKSFLHRFKPSLPLLFVATSLTRAGLAHAEGGALDQLKGASPAPVAAPTAPALPASEGPAAALSFEQSCRGPMVPSEGPYGIFPKAKPMALESLSHIFPLTESMWTRTDVLNDFRKNKSPEQIGAVVIVKTELCCNNCFRPCAVTTAAFEKFSTPLIKKFRVYAAWIKNNPARPEDKTGWEAKVEAEYKFEQGPGARIVAIVPDGQGRVHVIGAGAADIGLDLEHFELEQGRTPGLEEFLRTAIDSAKSAAK